LIAAERFGSIRKLPRAVRASFEIERGIQPGARIGPFFVQADDEVLFNEVAQVIDNARGAGADRVGLMTRQVAGK
jgi:biopolymer transport protein ExbD